MLIPKKAYLDIEIVAIGYEDLAHHLDNAEMTPELHHDLINFSFTCLQDCFKERNKCNENPPDYGVHGFTTVFLQCLKRLVRHHFYLCIIA